MSYQHQVYDTLFVDSSTKVLVITAREPSPDTVVSIHHAGDTIEAEAVELIFLHPETEVAQQETQDFMTTVVEKTAVP